MESEEGSWLGHGTYCHLYWQAQTLKRVTNFWIYLFIFRMQNDLLISNVFIIHWMNPPLNPPQQFIIPSRRSNRVLKILTQASIPFSKPPLPNYVMYIQSKEERKKERSPRIKNIPFSISPSRSRDIRSSKTSTTIFNFSLLVEQE